MFNFFCNLAISIYYGSWITLSRGAYVLNFINYMKKVPIFGLFNNSTEAFYDTTGLVVLTDFVNGSTYEIPGLALTIAVILSTICCISVFFIIVKAVKKLFTCFLGE